MLQIQIKNGTNQPVFVSEVYEKEEDIKHIKEFIDDALVTLSCSNIELKDISGNRCHIPRTIFSNNMIVMVEN